MRTKNTDSEKTAFDIARPLLEALFGVFVVDESQVDKPDAAINVIKPNKKHGRLNLRKAFKVGIEITTVDPRTYLRYNNERKRDQEKVEEKILESIETQKDIGQSVRYYKIPVTFDYISRAAEAKSEKYAVYTLAGNYGQMVLICFSNLVRVKDDFFEKGLQQWTAYNLSLVKFPFDVVIFVDVREGVAKRVYEKRKPILDAPPSYDFVDASVEKAESFVLDSVPSEYMNSNPIVVPLE
ncbi:MAG: hypothetical protein ACO1PM_18290 [Acidovorax sp.]